MEEFGLDVDLSETFHTPVGMELSKQDLEGLLLDSDD